MFKGSHSYFAAASRNFFRQLVGRRNKISWFWDIEKISLKFFYGVIKYHPYQEKSSFPQHLKRFWGSQAYINGLRRALLTHLLRVLFLCGWAGMKCMLSLMELKVMCRAQRGNVVNKWSYLLFHWDSDVVARKSKTMAQCVSINILHNYFDYKLCP